MKRVRSATIIFSLFASVLYSSFGFAQSALDYSIHQEYISLRAMGMGGAFAAVANDHSAIFYNPAMLAIRERGNVRMLLGASVDDEYQGLMDEIEDTEKEADEEQALVDVITDHYGDRFYFRAPTLGAFWVRPSWGVAFVPIDVSIDIGIDRGVGPSLNVNAYQDTTLAYSYARQIKMRKKDKLFVGVTAKFINRIYAGKLIPAAELAVNDEVFDNDDAAEGLTFDLDIGTLWQPYFREKNFFKLLKPQFAIVVRNAIDMGFPVNLGLVDDDPDVGVDEPPPLQRRIDVGTKLDLPNLWVFDPHFALDFRDILHDNYTLKKGLHAGFELYWTMFNWWKGYWSVGLNQTRYLTYGFGARLAWFNLELASWGEEVGTDADNIESRRYGLEMSLDF